MYYWFSRKRNTNCFDPPISLETFCCNFRYECFYTVHRNFARKYGKFCSKITKKSYFLDKRCLS